MKRASLFLLSVVSLAVQAQTQPPPGTPSDVRYTAPTAGEAALYPKQPGLDADKPRLFRGEQAGADYAANVNVARIVVEVDRNAVPADGQSPVKLVLRLFDKSGAPVKGTSLATIEHSGGRVLLPGARTDEFGPRRQDADKATPGVQLKVEDGLAEFTLLAPAEAQDVRVRISAGNEEASGTISFVPDLRPMVAAGLIEGIVNLRDKAVITPARRNDGFEQELQRWSRDFNDGKGTAAGRAAFFLKGTIRGDALLTAAYDSDKDTRARLLRDVRPDELYPVYGDASRRSFDARSAERLYVRLDKGKSYLLYGDFVTGDGFSQPLGQGAVASLKQRSLGNYNRTATGVRLHHEQGNFTGNVFAFRDSLRQVVEEIASQGSGPYGLRNGGALEGSEKVEVIVRDRAQPSTIVSVRALVRLVDYTFEPFSGRILLTSFLPAVDDNLNPVSLRVTYEVDQGGDPFWVAGADAQWRVSEAIEVGGSVVKDRNALAPYELLSGNGTLRLGARTAVIVEGAQSTSTVNTNPTNQSTAPALAGRRGEVQGRAARVELAHEGDRTDARLFAGRSSTLFNNPSAPLAGGRDELYARGGLKFTDTLKGFVEGSRSEDRNTGGGERSGAGIGLRWLAMDRLTLEASLRRARETIGTQPNGTLSWPYDNAGGLSGSIASGSGGGLLGYGNQVLDPATGLPVIQQTTPPGGVSSLPVGTKLESTTVRLGAGWRATDRINLGAEVESDVSGDDRRRVALGGDVAVAERTRLYGRWERQSGWVQLAGVSDINRSAGVWAFGIDTSYLPDTQLFSEYRLRDAVSGRDLQLASGIRNLWNVAEGWRISSAYENLRVLSGSTVPVRAGSIGLDWTAHPLWRGSGRAEVRRSGDKTDTPDNDRFTTTLLQGLLARKLDRDWTLLARNHYLRTNYTDRGSVVQDRAQLGLAYRDTDTNRVNALGKVEYKTERDASNARVGTLSSRAWITSLHGDWHPARPWWLTGRLAGKLQRDQFENGVQSRFKAALASGRVVWDVTENWDVSLLAATQFGQASARQYAYGAEVGYLLQQNLWLSAGFNATGFAGDADLAGYEYTRRGAYLRLRFKFDENVFKGADREVNRSLDR
jgi:hypothetical protein